MKKASLQDIKNNNRKLIIQALIDNGNMARVELAQITGLSPSTVTSLVPEFLDENILIETGREVSTGGRRRKELAINPGYGVIAVVEAGRARASIHYFDMMLEKLGKKQLASGQASGNRLLEAVSFAINEFFSTENIPREHLSGIGLLFQEDTQKDDFSVIFSTSLSADVITLSEALRSRFQVPVLEEYSMIYSINEALATVGESASKNGAYISLAGTIMTRVVIDGKPLPMKDGSGADLSRVVGDIGEMPPKANQKNGLATRVAALIALLCAMFPLEEVFIFDYKAGLNGFLQMLNSRLNKIMPKPPPIRAAELAKKEFAGCFAQKIRKRVLLADNTL